MGFYGNITNTSKTQFQFDRIYPNRKAMDEQVELDGIFIGRYVLIDYDEIYSPENENVNSNVNSSYEVNYRIDLDKYKNGKGYDSTAWQKVFVDGKEKYVMIAELNSVVPTLDLAIDPPSEIPMKPHFDADTTNVYYKIHLQPSWGFRVKEALEEEKSDETGNGKRLSIYYNKDGFNKDISHKDLDSKNEIAITTAKSGNEYNVDHDSHQTEPQDDIQELSIQLPVIGNIMSDVWDQIYGPNRDGIGDDNLVGVRNSTIEARNNALKATEEVIEATEDANKTNALMKQYINGPKDEENGIPEGGIKQLVVDTNNSRIAANQASSNAIDATKNANTATQGAISATASAITAANNANKAAARAESAADVASGKFQGYLDDNGYVNTSNAEENLKDILEPINQAISDNSDKIAINSADINTLNNITIPEVEKKIEELINNSTGEYLETAGGAMSGTLELQDKLVLSGTTNNYLYGFELPEEGQEGQIFFQVGLEDDSDLLQLIQELQNKVIDLTNRLSALEQR